MAIAFFEKLKNDPDNKLKMRIYRYLAWFLASLGIFIFLKLTFPTAVEFVLNIIWATLFAIVVVFLTLGVFVVIGLKDEVAQALDVILEGSLTLLDTLRLLKKIWERFVEVAKEFIIYCSPIFGYFVAAIIYLLVLVFYKAVGKSFDVALLTIVLTFVMVLLLGLLNRPKKDLDITTSEWVKAVKTRFKRGFIDGLEVVLFVFFLTMDSTKLPFLPESLNNELHAKLGTYDLMAKSMNLADHVQVTFSLIIATTTLEIIRNGLRVYAVARQYYYEGEDSQITSVGYARLKDSIRKSFGDAKDDLIRFITFTTVLLIVFLFFPRLKLLTLVVASTTAFLLDLFIKDRLVIKKSDDLISRILSKLFKI